MNVTKDNMKFKVTDRVKETHTPYQTGMVMEAYKDKQSASGEWYLVFFDNEQGNQWTDGSSFELEKPTKSVRLMRKEEIKNCFHEWGDWFEGSRVHITNKHSRLCKRCGVMETRKIQ